MERGQPLAPPTLLALPTDIGSPTGRTGLAVLGVERYGRWQWCQSLEGSIDGSTARTRLEGVPRRWAKSAQNRCVRSRALLHPASQSAVRQWRLGEVGASHGVTATLRRCGHAGWDPALKFGAGLGGYSCDAGNKPQPSAGPSPRPACVEVARQPVRPAPQHVSTACSECAPILGRAFAACRVACSRTRRMPTITQLGVIKPGRH